MPVSKQLFPSLVALTASAVMITAEAQTPPPPPPAPPAPEPEYTLTANVGIFSQYVFRGVSQTNEKPAIQGGFDFSHKSGFYLGTWASNISWLSDAVSGTELKVSAPIEWDFYGGYKGTLPMDFGYDIGGLYYYYPGNYPGNGYTKPDTFEVYGALSWKFVSVKYSYSTGHTFGFADSSGSSYVEGNLTYDVLDKVSDMIGKLTVIGHVGHQWFKGSTAGFNNSAFNYTDWKIGASVDALGVTLGLFVTDTNANKDLYTNPFGKKIADTQVVGYVQKTF